MNILLLDPLHDFLSPLDLNRLMITCKTMGSKFTKQYIRYITNKRARMRLDSFEILYYGIIMNKKNFIYYVRHNFHFLMIHFGIKKKIIYEKWYDRYLSILFNYYNPFNYFLYQNGEIYKNIVYFEITLLRTLNRDDESISIGFSTWPTFTSLVELSYLNGWLKNTIAYHTDDGYIYKNGDKTVFFNNMNQLQTIGCGNNMEKGFIFFIHEKIRYKWEYNNRSMIFYPSIVGDVDLQNNIKINYGQKKFIYHPIIK